MPNTNLIQVQELEERLKQLPEDVRQRIIYMVEDAEMLVAAMKMA